MRSGPAAIAALLPALALFFPGCGDEQPSAAGAEKGVRSTPATAPSRATPGGPNADERVAVATAARRREAAHCGRALGDFLDAMESLNNSVAVGVSYDSYLSVVNDVRSAYAPIQADDLPLICLTQVAGPAERALNTYIDAANAWGDCLADTACDPESIEAGLQRKWSRASGYLADARAGLGELGSLS